MDKLWYYLRIKLAACALAFVFVTIGTFIGDLNYAAFLIVTVLIGATATVGLLLLRTQQNNNVSSKLTALSLSSDIVPMVVALYLIGGLTSTWLFFLMIFIFVAGYLFNLRSGLLCATFGFASIVVMFFLECQGAIPTFGTYSLGEISSWMSYRHWKDYLFPIFLLYYVSAIVSGRLNSIMHKYSSNLEESNTLLKKEIEERKLAEEKLKKYTEELARSNRELQDFAYVASHDLQEPLRKVRSFGERVCTKYASTLDEKGMDYLTRMQNAAERMQKMITDLLTFSRVTTTTRVFYKGNLKNIFKGIISDLEVSIEQTHAQIEIGEIPPLEADPLQMRQLFQNLLSNALKFSRTGVPPIIKINSTSADGFCIITVEDNGIGFNEKYADRIFNPFERLHSRSEYEGTGMGLALCRKIVENHSGNITVKSKPGSGSNFIITLPIIHISTST